jgi:signal transduction histidine kinase
MMSLAQMDLDATKKYEPVEIGNLLSEMENEFTSQAQLKQQILSFAPIKTLVHVNGDPLQMRQLFRNLIGNAIKYTPKGGTIMLTTKINKDQALIEVKDNGYGIPSSDLPFIFNRFYRVRSGKNGEEEGNGLGLAIVKSIVEHHGGQISVESEPQKGTSFNISLPALIK